MALDANRIAGGLMKRGFAPAAAYGIAANIKHESGFDTGAVGDNGTSIGLAQWHGPRADALKAFAKSRGSDWRDATVQLDFLSEEVDRDMPGFRDRLNSIQDPHDAARLFVVNFERPAGLQGEIAKRGATARSLWDQFNPIGRAEAAEPGGLDFSRFGVTAGEPSVTAGGSGLDFSRFGPKQPAPADEGGGLDFSRFGAAAPAPALDFSRFGAPTAADAAEKRTPQPVEGAQSGLEPVDWQGQVVGP